MYHHILLEIDDGIAIVTLNRPDKLNAYTVDMGEEIVAVFDQLRDDENAAVVILTGAGRGFCAGVDLDHMKAQAAGDIGDGPRLGEERLVREFPLTLLDYPKPVIAAINGHAIGVGITMVLACDVRIAADTAKFGLTFAKMGILPGLGSTYLLPKLIGSANAKELVLSARVFLAPEAASMGLVTQVFPADQLLSEAKEMAIAMIQSKPQVLAAAKALLTRGDSERVADAMQQEQLASAALRK
ncbi:MAG: enoyl-CoA hydratase/carnithine racemase [Halioglobus sp.]|jgi:enoyl-CoA hydratase/carnithine racemase